MHPDAGTWQGAADASGNSYFVGSFSNSIDFGTGTLYPTGTGSAAFIVKYNASGTAIWYVCLFGINKWRPLSSFVLMHLLYRHT